MVFVAVVEELFDFGDFFCGLQALSEREERVKQLLGGCSAVNQADKRLRQGNRQREFVRVMRVFFVKTVANGLIDGLF